VGFFFDGLREAWNLIVGLDRGVLDATGRTLVISVSAVIVAACIGIPAGAMVARRSFVGRGVLVASIRAGMAVPTVFVGVVCYGLFSRQGMLGPFELLYTQRAIALGEVVLALPIIFSLSHGAVLALDPRIDETARSLGAGAVMRFCTDLSEARTGVVLALLTAFARCATELGIALMVGGNLAERTRTLATATTLEVEQGNFPRGLATGLILLIVSLGMTSLVAFFTREEDRGREAG